MSSIGTLTIDIAANVARLQADMNAVKNQVGGAMSGISSAADFAKKAFAGLAAGMSIGAFVGMIKGSIDAAGALHDLSIKTGASVESLSKFQEVARLSDVSVDAIGQSMNRLAKSMAGADEDSKGAAQALKALGLNFAEFKALSPDDQMVAVAKAMAGFEDGAGKSAAAMALFGKTGAELLPFMADLANTGDLQARVTTAQAAAADEFGDNLTKLKVSGGAWTQELAMGMVPALSEASAAFVDVFNGSGGLRDEIQRLARDGTLAEWTRMAVTGLTYVMDAVTGVWRTFRSLGEYLGGSLAAWGAAFGALGGAAAKAFSGDFKGALAEAKTGVQQWNQITTEMGENIGRIWSEQTMGQRIRARMAEVKQLGDTSQAAKPKLDLSAPIDKTTKAAKEQAAAIKELTKVEDIEIDILKALKKEHADQLDAVRKGTDEIRKQIDEQRKANEEVGLSTEALGELEVTRLRDAAAIAERNAVLADETLINGDIAEQYRQQAAGLRELADLKAEGVHLKAAQESAAEWKKTSDQIFESMTDALFRAFEEGKSLFGALRDTLVNTFKTLILRPTIQAVMAPVAGAVGGLLGGPAMAATGGLMGGGGLLGGLGAIGGGLGMLGSGLGYGLAAWGSSATIGGTLAGAGSMLTAGSFGSALAGIGAVAGVALPVLAGALVLKKLLGRGKKKVTERGLEGNVLAGDFEGHLFADWKQSGGLFHKRRTGTNLSPLTDELSTALDEGGAAVFSQVSNYATALGLPAEALANVSHHMRVTLGEDEAANQRAIEEAFGGYADKLSDQFKDSLRPFQEAGETMSETMQRLAEIQTFSETMNEFGGVFSRVATLGLRAKEELIGFAGGIEALVSKTSSFVDNYYSDAEKFGIGARQIQEQLAALGITGNISSRADFRALVEGTDVSTTEGRQMLADLLTLAQSFAPVAQYLEQNGGTLADLAAQAPSTSIVESVLNDQEVLAEYQQRTADGVDLLNGSVLSIGERISQAIAAGNADLLAALIAIARNTADTTRKLDEWDAGGSMTTTAA